MTVRQLHGLRRAVVVKIVCSRQGLPDHFPGSTGQASLVHDQGAGVGVPLPAVAAPAYAHQQAVLLRPRSPILRQERVFRDGAAVRQGKVPGSPGAGLNDPDRLPAPGAVSQSQIPAVGRPQGGLGDPALVPPQYLPGLCIHHLEGLRRLDAADILAAGPRRPDLKPPIRGAGLPLHTGHRRGGKHLDRLSFRRHILRLPRSRACPADHCRRHRQQGKHSENLPFFHKNTIPTLLYAQYRDGDFLCQLQSGYKTALHQPAFAARRNSI